MDAIREQIGYPDYILNDTVLNEEFEYVSNISLHEEFQMNFAKIILTFVYVVCR